MVGGVETGSWTRWGGLGLLAFGVAIHLVFGIAETVGGEEGGWIHLVAAAVLAALLAVAVRHPFGVGLVLLAVAVVLAALPAFLDQLDWSSTGLAVPPLLAGALLVFASRQPEQPSTLRPPPA
jgi:hypothetical protein